MVPKRWSKQTFNSITQIGNGQVDPKVELNPVAVPELAIVTPDGILIVSPEVPKVKVVPVLGST